MLQRDRVDSDPRPSHKVYAQSQRNIQPTISASGLLPRLVLTSLAVCLLSNPLSAAALSPPDPNTQQQIAKPAQEQTLTSAPSVDLVLALDISGSMSGLIDSAKQRLWDVVNELGQAQPSPNLRVAIVTFGKPAYGIDSGYVKINQPLTSDLDAVNQALFSFQTSGGDEYVARAIHRSLTELDWSKKPNTSKVLFVAGNESAAQDPNYSLETVAAQARQQGLIVNAIFCGDTQAGDARSWAQIAQLGGGMYAAINQQAGAIAKVSTPMDKQIAQLNNKLNATYLFYGSQGQAASANQEAQDRNSQSMSDAALVSRTVAKASKLYRNKNWDLLDALDSGVALEDIPSEALPKPLQALDSEEQLQFLSEQKAERQRLQEEISELGQARQKYLEANRDAKPGEADDTTLEAALKAGLQKAIQGQGITLAGEAQTP